MTVSVSHALHRRVAHKLFTRSVLLITALLLACCHSKSESDQSPPPQPPVPPTTIGAAGGTINGPNGAKVTIPAGALSVATPIAVTQSGAGAPALPAGAITFGEMYSFTPHGTTFSVPVTVTLPFNPASLPPGSAPLLFKTNAQGAWERVPGITVNGGMITASVTSFSVFVAAPLITRQPQSATVQGGAAATFSATALGQPILTYAWQRSDDDGLNWIDVANSTANTYTTPATVFANDNNDRYRVIVTSTVGTDAVSSTSDSATLTVTPVLTAPTITTQPINVSVQAPTTATFSVAASGTAPLSYQWERSNDGGGNYSAIVGATSASYATAATVVGDNNARFRVMVSNTVSSVTSDAGILTVTTIPPAPSGAIARIAAGSDFSIARLANGDPRSWGSDAAGTLGAGNGDQTRNTPGAVLANNIVSVAAGSAHGLAVRGTGEVRGWGYNGFGQLGNNNNQTADAPVSSLLDNGAGGAQYTDAIAVCGGSLHSLVLQASGQVRAMGYNADGQLGDSSNTEHRMGVAVTGIATATAIACGANHSLALLADGTVRAWGNNGSGRLGNGSVTNSNAPVTVSGLANVIAISAGSDHSMAVRSDGTVWAWGANTNGKLGDGTETSRSTPVQVSLTGTFIAVAGGGGFSLALRNDGVVYTWGINEAGQLASGSLTPGYRPTPAQATVLANIVAIATSRRFGLEHAFAVRNDGVVFAWGYNDLGQLGDGTAQALRSTPVQVPGLNLN